MNINFRLVISRGKDGSPTRLPHPRDAATLLRFSKVPDKRACSHLLGYSEDDEAR